MVFPPDSQHKFYRITALISDVDGRHLPRLSVQFLPLPIVIIVCVVTSNVDSTFLMIRGLGFYCSRSRETSRQ
ncbi:MAG: hypothetical protein WCD53_25290 [Microcoleus sp.]